jgi:hypothetical protein
MHGEGIPLRARFPYDADFPRVEIEESGENKATTPIFPVRATGRRLPPSWIERLWFVELLACMLSIACLRAIVGVLIRENGKPLDN